MWLGEKEDRQAGPQKSVRHWKGSETAGLCHQQRAHVIQGCKTEGGSGHSEDLSLLFWPAEGIALLVSQARQGKQPVIYLLQFIYEMTRLQLSPYLIISCTGSLTPQHYILWNSLDVNFFSQLGVCGLSKKVGQKLVWVYIVQLQLSVSGTTSQGPWACPDIYLHVSDLQDLSLLPASFFQSRTLPSCLLAPFSVL